MELIGFIGLGTIGGTVATHINKAGYPVMVHDILPEAVRSMLSNSVRSAETPAEIARHCKIIFTSLPGPAEVEAVALGPSSLSEQIQAGALYVDLSSSSPDLIRRIDADFRSRGAEAMDAPLIVGSHGIANKDLQVLASGSAEAYARAKPILQTFGDPVIYTGVLGNGTVIKLAHNLVRRGIGLAIGEGIVLGAKAGVDPQLVWDCMRWGLEVQLNQLSKAFSEIVFRGNYEAPASFGLGLSRKDVALATALGRQHNVPMPIASLVEQFMIQAIERGWYEQSTASLFRLQEEAAGVEVRAKAIP
jgi:3-hydroxyisobutyrate dehydrogenase